MHDERTAAGYVRVSTEEQTRGYSLEAQREAIASRALSDGAAIDAECVFVDAGISGARADRPAYQAMLAAAAAGAFKTLYVWKFDRLGRDAEELLRARRMLEAAGVRLVSITEGEAEGTLIYGVRALVAQEEREKIAERTRLGVRARTRAGAFHGRAPYGYVRVDGEVVRDEAQAAVVVRMFAEYDAGAGDSPIAHGLNEDGVTPPRGGKWDRSQVANVLKNPAYIGLVRINEETFPGHHAALIDDDTWERVQRLRAIRAERSKGRGRPIAGRHLLVNGLLRCGECKNAMRPRTYRHRDLEVYICTTRDGYRGGERCSMKPIERAEVDEAILDHFETFGLDIEATKAELVESARRALHEAAALATRAESDVVRAEDAIARLDRDYRDGRLPARLYTRNLEAAEEERQGAAAEAATYRARIRSLERALEAIDADTQLAQRVAQMREEVAGTINSATTIAALRAAIAAVFIEVNLQCDGGGERYLTARLRRDAMWSPTEFEAVAIRSAAAGGGVPPHGTFPSLRVPLPASR